MMDSAAPAPEPSAPTPHRRRPRYSGKNPRKFEHKYKEHQPEKYTETIQKVLASGKTPAGSHRPIMVREILEILNPLPGETAIDCTLGYGGHSREILPRLQPGGMLLGLDADPLELSRTETRLRDAGFGVETFRAIRTNFAGIGQVLSQSGIVGADVILADLGVSSMQLDNPARGFSVKLEGPLDMRMNPQKGKPASELLHQITTDKLQVILQENADEPRAEKLAQALAGAEFKTTQQLAKAIRAALPGINPEEKELSVRRTFQALRIAVNDEFGALDSLLRCLPHCLKPGGRVAILTFHSGEDRRVKKAFAAAKQSGVFGEISEEVVRPSAEERNLNPRSSSAKLRWAKKPPGSSSA